MADIYYINDVDLSTLMTIQRIDATAHAPTILQKDFLVPGRTGTVAVKPWFGPSTIMVGGLVQGATRGIYLDRIARLVSVFVNSGLPFTFKRTLQRASGTSTAVGQARYTGGLDYIEELSNSVSRVMAEFSLLSSFWSDENYTTTQALTTSFSLVVTGDTSSNDIIVTLAGGSSQRLTNSTTGDYVELTGLATTSTSAVLNVGQFTALQSTTNVIDKVTPNPANRTQYWITLQPGTNNFVLTGGGTAVIQYKGKFL